MTPSTQAKKLEWPPQSPDLNRIENLWTDVHKALDCNLTSNEALWMVVKESWERISITRCQDLVEALRGRNVK